MNGIHDFLAIHGGIRSLNDLEYKMVNYDYRTFLKMYKLTSDIIADNPEKVDECIQRSKRNFLLYIFDGSNIKINENEGKIIIDSYQKKQTYKRLLELLEVPFKLPFQFNNEGFLLQQLRIPNKFKYLSP